MSAPEANTPELESHIKMPNGGVAPRCQRAKRDGKQCLKPARRGYRTCPSHGAGYASREQAGERKTPGRPVTHGVYSVTPTRSYAEAAEELAGFEDALTSSDRDLLALKASLLIRLGQLDALAPDVQHFEDDLEQYVTEAADMDDNPLTPAEARQLASRFASWLAPLSALDRAVSRIADAATKSVTAHKTRAETSAKLAEAEGVGYALQIIQAARRIVHALLEPDLAATYELALAREVYGPLRLEPPPLREVN